MKSKLIIYSVALLILLTAFWGMTISTMDRIGYGTTAWHEDAHKLISEYMGYKVVNVSIYPSGLFQYRGLTLTQYDLNHYNKDVEGYHIINEIVAYNLWGTNWRLNMIILILGLMFSLQLVKFIEMKLNEPTQNNKEED